MIYSFDKIRYNMEYIYNYNNNNNYNNYNNYNNNELMGYTYCLFLNPQSEVGPSIFSSGALCSSPFGL